MPKKNSQYLGLTSYQADKKLEQIGINVLEEYKRISPFQILLQQFVSPLIIILLFAATASFILGEVDALVILIAVMLNTALGFWQEYKAEKNRSLISIFKYTCYCVAKSKTY